MLSRPSALLAALLLGLSAARLRAAEVEAVLSSDISAYREAFAGFQEAYGEAVSSRSVAEAAQPFPPGTKVVVAFGGKAALAARAEGAFLVYGLSPGTMVPVRGGFRGATKIAMVPEPHKLVSEVRRLQPKLRRLLVVWATPGFADYAGRLSRAGAPLGVEIVECALGSRDELPDCLRARGGSVDALWLAPDPLLISADSILTARSFSWSSKAPLYVSIEGLLDKGAAVSVSAGFRAMGRALGKAARQALSGKEMPEDDYAEECETRVNPESAARAGL